MRILPALLAAVVSFCVLSCSNADDRSAGEQPAADTLQAPLPATENPLAANQIEISGLLQSSGLQPDEAKGLGIKHNGFQLLADSAYFLQGAPDTLANYLGRCLTLTGKLAEGWASGPQQINGQYTYNRRLLMVEKISLQPYESCFFTDTLSQRPAGRAVTYIGQVVRMTRPAPDIAYDYQLRLQKPYRNPNDPVQPGRLVRELPLTANKYEILSTLEKAVQENKSLRVQGIQHQGYAESEALWVEAAGDPAL